MSRRMFYVEVFDIKEGDSDYSKSKEFKTRKAAERYAAKMGKKLEKEDYYVFLYIPMNDGCSDYNLRQEYTFGYHNKWLDEKIF